MRKLFVTIASLLLAVSTIGAAPHTAFASDEVTDASSDDVQVVECESTLQYYRELTQLVNEEDKLVKDGDEKGDYQSARVLMKADGSMELSGYEGACKVLESEDGMYVVQFETSDQAKAAVKELNKKKKVEFAEPDVPVSTAGALDEADALGETGEEQLQQDENGSGLHMSWGASSYTIEMGYDEYASYAYMRSYSELVVAVVDTGVTPESFVFEDRMLKGRNMISQNSNTLDDNGHGTHVAGIVADCTSECPNIKIMPIKVLNSDGRGYASVLAAGVKYAADKGAKIINISVVGSHSKSKDKAIKYATSKGALCVVASGNKNHKLSSKDCPAHMSEVLVVGAMDQNLGKASFSNYGKYIYMTAPGVNVASASRSGGVEMMSGTSMATPHISASAALVKAAARNLSPDQIKTAIRHSAVDIGSKGWDKYYGYGYSNLIKLLNEDYVPPRKVSSLKKFKSKHNYGSSYDDLAVYTAKSGTKCLKVKFSSRTYTEPDCDFITIYDKSDNVIGIYSGKELAGKTVYVPGKTVKVRLTSDGSNNKWGYEVTSVKTLKKAPI